jgi:hypothetical protein
VKESTTDLKTKAFQGQVRLAKDGKVLGWLKTVDKEALLLDFKCHIDWTSTNVYKLPKKKSKVQSSDVPSVSNDFQRKLDPRISTVVEDQARLTVESRKAAETLLRLKCRRRGLNC